MTPYAPKLNRMENIWDYLRANKLSHVVWDSHDAIIAACKKVWQFLVNDPKRIQSIGNREWTCVRARAVGIRLVPEAFRRGARPRIAGWHL